MNNNKQAIKNFIQDHGSIAQQLHQIRSSKQLSLKQVCIETGLPEYVVDSLEIGHGALRLPDLYLLAKYYGKKVQISLID